MSTLYSYFLLSCTIFLHINLENMMMYHNDFTQQPKEFKPNVHCGNWQLDIRIGKSILWKNSEIQMETRMWIGECLNCKVHTSARERMNYACSWSHLCMSERLPWHVTVKHNTSHAGYVMFLSITSKSKPFLMLKSVFRQHCFNTGPLFYWPQDQNGFKIYFLFGLYSILLLFR